MKTLSILLCCLFSRFFLILEMLTEPLLKICSSLAISLPSFLVFLLPVWQEEALTILPSRWAWSEENVYRSKWAWSLMPICIVLYCCLFLYFAKFSSPVDNAAAIVMKWLVFDFYFLHEFTVDISYMKFYPESSGNGVIKFICSCILCMYILKCICS